MPKIAFSTTADIPVPKNICDQIIGQDGAVEIIKKAAIQRRHVVLVGAPGTGKSLLGLGLAVLAMIIPWWVLKIYGEVMAAASLIAGVIFVGAVAISFGLNMRKTKVIETKLIVDHSKIQKAPFYDATGAHAGALLGDVLH